MKFGKSIFLVICFFSVSHQLHSDSTIDGLKGIWSSIKSFPLFSGSFWKGIGRGFGAPPTGYVYSYKVHNDTNVPAWVATQGLASVMGGVFPEASGWECTKIDPYTAHGQDNKEYYFELFIKTTPKSYSNHMPYIQHDDVLYQTEKINLIPKDKNSKHRNHFRVYMGKTFVSGAYQHQLKAEYVGYENMVSNPSDKNALSLNSAMQTLTIKNSTEQDYYVGFTAQAVSNISSASMCSMVGLVEKDSFGLLSAAGSITTFRPGTIGIFRDLASESIATVAIGQNGFANFSYTLEIYQEAGQADISCQWQGITPGHYDMPVNRIKDITPIIGCLWYQSVQQTKGTNLADLPGTVWIVSIEKKSGKGKTLGMAQPGQVLQFMIERPRIADKNEIYFLYIEETNVVKAQAFVQNFLSGKIGAEAVTLYHDKLSSVMQSTELQLNPKTVSAAASSSSSPLSIPSTLINQITSGALALNRGQIVDTTSGTTGFLLGYDVFMPLGIGAGPFYYQLVPSYTANASKALPTSSVANLFTTAPNNMPKTAAVNTYAPTTYAIA
jgi:hypothetical protein